MITSKIMMAVVMLLGSTLSFAQIKNQKTISAFVDGNCGMCQKNIENAGTLKNEAKVSWKADGHEAVIVYDSTKTDIDAVLKRIALAGYDNEKYLAPTATYNSLHGCCQYDRTLTAEPVVDENKLEGAPHNHQHNQPEALENSSDLQASIDWYLQLKDALVSSHTAQVTAQAKALAAALDNIKMEKLTNSEHQIWMKIMSDIKKETKNIASAKNIEEQRKAFARLSPLLFSLVKDSKLSATLYYQKCPMYNDGKGATWLSKDSAIKNPYYGAKMLSCGSTEQTLK
ncbi:DUF3347 domain-containing protein [Sphingobacterium sp. Mn56C]|uniref:DUF3347 domain-containing protein n=1 Tax=Sphingobacterium sp. Mn56C TaxID=3395261 RepID=UPI003BE928CA